MRRSTPVLSLGLVFGILGCDGGGEELPPVDVAAWAHLEVGLIEYFDIDHGGVTLDGRREVGPIDSEYRQGVEAYKVLTFQNGILIATRWYQETQEGILCLGEEVVESMQVVPRTYVTPVKALPYPLVNEFGQTVQSWTTTTDLEEGGTETHLYTNLGLNSLTVPAGTYEAYHFVHTRTDAQGTSHQLDEYFVPDQGIVEFEYPQDDVWTLLPPP